MASNQELKKLLEQYENDPLLDEEYADISEEELNSKIDEIKKQIDEKDVQLNELSSQIEELSEKDIRDPEFIRTIQAIRARKQEIINIMNEDKIVFENHSKKNKQALEEAYAKYADAKSRRDALDDEYKNVGDQTSLRREEYLAKSQKLTFEEETIQRCIDERKEDEKIASEKFANSINQNEAEIKELSRKEVETIKYYLEKLKNEASNDDESYQKYAQEKLELMKQLDDLNVIHLQMQVALEQSRNMMRESLKESEEVLEKIASEEYSETRREKLTEQITMKSNQYDSLLHKISQIREHQLKRSKSEKVLRITDETIVRYNEIVNDYDTLILRYQTNNEVLSILKQDLSTLDAEKDQEEINNINTKISNVEVLQADISDKIDYCKILKDDLELDDKVNYYIRLLKSMEQLKVKNIEFRVQANNLKARIEEMKAELESLK